MADRFCGSFRKEVAGKGSRASTVSDYAGRFCLAAFVSRNKSGQNAATGGSVALRKTPVGRYGFMAHIVDTGKPHRTLGVRPQTPRHTRPRTAGSAVVASVQVCGSGAFGFDI